MKKISLFLTVLCLVMLSNLAQAQDYNGFGFKAGLNFNNIKYEGDSDMKLGFHIGGYYTFEVESFRFQPGLSFVQRGAKGSVTTVYTTTDVGGNRISTREVESGDVDMILNYLEIPVNISYKVLDFNQGNSALSIFVEPSLGFCLSGKLKYEDSSDDFEIGSDDTDDIKTINFGIKLGASVQVGKFEPYIGYDLGLNDITPASQDMMNRGFYLGVAYNL
ncbi:PorT family protein [Halosquirtibacter xylanolyticus]|uniref:porin family protein n=1 Tax=Halosquirtibacter xylanolyticus TaxID=3374599 RepID=UPI003747F4A1|nr:PorT family protein [Prolixibacteraceae bacterium]